VGRVGRVGRGGRVGRVGQVGLVGRVGRVGRVGLVGQVSLVGEKFHPVLQPCNSGTLRERPARCYTMATSRPEFDPNSRFRARMALGTT
jgi:hypothetical protein